jgi:hypothetical protein
MLPRVLQGQALTEYLICAAVMALALLIPMGESAPVVIQLAKAIRNFYRGFSFLLSIS